MSEQQLMVVLGADTSDFTRAMAQIQAQMRQTANSIERSMNNAENTVDRKTNQMGGHFDKLKGIMGGLGKSMKVGSIVGGLSSAIPVLATATAGVGALGSAFMSAGVGIAGFGAVAVANLNDVFTATDETFGNLSSAQQKAYKDLKGFKSFWGDFSKEFEQPTMDMFSKGLNIAQGVLTSIKPAIQGTADAVNGLMDSMGTSLKSDDMVRFFDYINATAGSNVTAFGQIFGNTFRGIANLMVAFAPMSKSVMDGLVGMTEKFAEWSSALVGSTGFQAFSEYVKTNAPVVMGVIRDISTTVWDLIVALAPLGQAVLGTLGQILGAVANFAGNVKSAFSVSNFVGLGEAFGQLIPQIVTVLVSAIPQIMALSSQLMTGFLTGLTNNIPLIVQSIIGLIQTIINNFATNVPLVVNAGLQLIMALITGIVQALPQLISSAVLTIQTMITTLSTAIATYLPQIIQAGIQLILSLIQGIVTALPQIVQSIITLITTVLETILTQLPVILTAGIQILQALIQGIMTMLPQLIEMVITLISTVFDMLVANLPMIIQAGIQLLNSLIDGVLSMLPQLITMTISLITRVMDIILDNLPMIISAGMELLVALVNGIAKALPQLVEMAVALIIAVVGTLLEHLPEIISAGVEILVALIEGLIDTIPTLVGAIPKIVKAIFNAFGDVDWSSIGMDIIKGIGKGLTEMTGWIKDKVGGIAKGLISKAQNVLDINSPSKVFADQVGKFIPQGIAVGIKAESDVPLDAVNDISANLVPNTSDMNLSSWLNPLPKMGGKSDSDASSNQITNHYVINATIREDADIKKISQQIAREQQKLNRAGGKVQYGY